MFFAGILFCVGLLMLVLVVLGHWQYAAISFVIIAALVGPFVLKARKMSEEIGRLAVKRIAGAVLLLVIFIVVVFLAAIVLNYGYWYLFKR